MFLSTYISVYRSKFVKARNKDKRRMESSFSKQRIKCMICTSQQEVQLDKFPKHNKSRPTWAI